jgi:phosphoesterase RecJ-like protein
MEIPAEPNLVSLKEFSNLLNQQIKSSKRIFMFFHENPDLDSVGSNYSLHDYCLFINPNAQIQILSTDNPNLNLRELVTLYSTKNYQVLDPSNLNFLEGDLILMVDYSEAKRISKKEGFEFPNFVKILSLDHHRVKPTHEMYYLNYDNQSACSIVYELFKLNDFEISENTFKFIVMGIIGDSGYFRHKDTKFTQTINCIKEMVTTYGSESYYSLISNLEKNQPVEEFYLKKIYLNNLVFKENFAYTSITNEDREKSKIPLDYSAISGASNFIKNIGNTKFVFAVSQDILDKNLYNLSFRSCAGSGFIVRDIAEKLGGGGHNEASGAQVRCENIDEAIKLVMSTINELAKL